MKPGDIPLSVLVGSFLKACMQQGVEAVVWASLRGTNKESISSNTGDIGIGKARKRLSIKTGGIEAAAMAIHGFRLVEEGKTVEPAMDFCPFLPCASHVDEEASAAGRGYGAVPWDDLPDVVKAAHRELAKVVLGAALSSGPVRALTSV